MSGTAQRKGILDIPMRLIFTDEGVHYFTSQNRKISRFKLSDGVEEYGIHVVDFAPSTIQRMQLLGYLSKIEISLSDLIAKRREVIDLIKLLSYGMLYRQYDTQVFSSIVESELIKAWNRHNIKNPIDYKTRINAAVLRNVLDKNNQAISEIKELILKPILQRILQNEHLQDSEKMLHTHLARKFLDTLNPLIFFILTVHRGSTGYFQIIRDLQRHLLNSMDRSSIPEYLALMVVEILVNMSMEDPNSNISSLLKDDNIYVLFRLNKKRQEPGDRARLTIMISDQKRGFDDLRQRINSRLTTNISGRSLKDFYNSSPDLHEQMNLGLYYLSYLSEACKKVGINFESFVNRIESEGLTTIHITLTF